MAEGNPADLLRDAIGEKAVEPRLRAWSGYEALGEGGHVLETDILHHVPAFLADEAEVVGTPERPFLNDAPVFGRRRVVVAQERVRPIDIGLAQRIAGRREPAR